MATSPSAPLPLRLVMRIPVPWVFVLAYLAGAGWQRLLPLATPAPRDRRALAIAGILLWTLAVTLAGWALVLFRRRRTTTTPGEISRAFVAAGPYRLSRNPMYLGLVLAYLGEMFFLAQLAPLLPLLLVIAYLQWVVIPLEESRLSAAFAAPYAQYAARVRRWL